MIELVARKGYPSVRILDLAKLAHVSQPTFYNLYAEKEALFLSAYEEIAQRTALAVMRSYDPSGPADAAPARGAERLRGARRGRAGGDVDARARRLRRGPQGAGAPTHDARRARAGILEPPGASTRARQRGPDGQGGPSAASARSPPSACARAARRS